MNKLSLYVQRLSKIIKVDAPSLKICSDLIQLHHCLLFNNTQHVSSEMSQNRVHRRVICTTSALQFI